MRNVKFGHAAGFAALLCVALMFSDTVNASGGSWGGRGLAGGAWGGGSRGGLLSGRAPVRNLLGRAAFGAGRLVNGVGNAGRGIAGNRPRLLSRLGGRLAGGGSVGGGYGSVGGSVGSGSVGSYGGSVGSYSGYSSIGSSYGSVGGSVGSYIGSPVGSSTGSWGGSYAATSSVSANSWGPMSYVSTIGGSYNAPIESQMPTSFDMPYVEPGISTGYDMMNSGAVMNGAVLGSGMGFPMNSSYPMDSGVINSSIPMGTEMGMPMNSGMPIDMGMNMGSGIPMDMGMPIGGNPGMIEGAMPAENFGGTGFIQSDSSGMNGTIDPNTIYDSNDPPNSIIEPTENNFDGISNPNGFDPNGLETPPMPQPSEDNTETNYRPRPRNNNAVLSLKLPKDATVYINDRPTKTSGSIRSYVSKRLKQGKDYEYRVKAVVKRDGKEVVRTRKISLVPGLRKTVAFDFNRPAVTTLAVKVPSDAKVILAGNETSLEGRTRYFSTRTLKDGKSWSDYKIQVSVVRNGKTITRERSIDIASGQTRLVKFNFATDQVATK